MVEISYGHYLGDMEGVQYAIFFKDKATLEGDLTRKVKFLVASLVSMLPQFHNIPISSIMKVG